MQLALVNEKKLEAFPKGRGFCPICGAETIAKCGPRVVHHWAHLRKRDCDPWWENETLWHREWKNRFPLECREISHVAEDGEIHRADIKTPTGIVIEVQHSSMTDAERISREKFYKNLVWVIDGSAFKDNFDIYHMLPDPRSELAQDLVWSKSKRHMHGANTGIFFRLSEAIEVDPEVTKATLRGGWIHEIYEIENQIKESYNGYQQYDWVRPRKTWLDANCPVYIDFGDEYLVKLEIYDESGLKCIRLVSKLKFVHDAMTESEAQNIATRFYPINKEQP
ncbi:competence protein CoiA [Gayadomonas joobiniege]|uniref:competence protein CoiA n=1 Tax=Gayadomonas joobiniege TaxID=1234606 RepID=UPI0003603758|nr:competence protein CoiA family protein [Gayadomonas joobiniege]